MAAASMAEAEDGPVVDQAGEDDSDEEVAATASAKKKKRRNKKKNSAAVAEVQPEEVVLDLAASAPSSVAKEAATEADADEAEAEAEDDEEAAAPTKKKKKKKKKASAEVEPENALEEVLVEVSASTAAPPAGQKEEVAEGTDEEAEDSGAENGTADPKKKRRKKKKKSAAAGSANVPIVADNGGKGVPKYIPDEEFSRWVAEGLKATANGTEKASREELLKPPKEFWGYRDYTGSLRPAFVTPQMKMPEFVAKPDYATHSQGASLAEANGPKEVPILEGKDLQTMREACRYGREVLDIAARYLVEGVTGDEIDRIVYQACVDRKIYPSPLNYYRFPKSVCVSPNEVICHGIPDCRPIQRGDIVNLDVSIYHNGFHADLNETYFVGECDEDAHRVVRTAYCALHAAAQLIRPGTLYRELGNVIQTEATKSKCAVVTTYCGHGVGQLFHGPPKIPHYRKNKAVGVMKPGHVFTVEPMINLGSNGGDRTWPDDWTAVTRDGKRSAQFEHTFLVTETGVELLTCRHGTDPFSMPAYDGAMFQR